MGYQDRNYYRPSGVSGFSFFPPMIKLLLISNVAVFVLMIIASGITIDYPLNLNHLLTKYFALIPFSDGIVPIDNMRGIDAVFLPWQLITYQFMHSLQSFTHILFNMFMLWMFGMELENMMGSKKFLIFYLISGVGAGLLHLLFSPGHVPVIGASGAVYGVMVAFAMSFPDRYIYIYFLIPVKAKYLITFLVIFEYISVGSPSIVAHLAHLGGALTGAIFILIDRKYYLRLDKIFDNLKNTYTKKTDSGPKTPFRRPVHNQPDVQDANFYDINDVSSVPDQEEIDRILDKISRSGYQNLTEKEKKILFNASKKN